MSKIVACRREEPETLLACTNRAIYWNSQPKRIEWDADDVKAFVDHAFEKARQAADSGRFSVFVPIVALQRMGEHIDLSSPPASVINELQKDLTLRARFVGPDWKMKFLRCALMCSSSSDMREACVHGAYVLDWQPVDSVTKS